MIINNKLKIHIIFIAIFLLSAIEIQLPIGGLSLGVLFILFIGILDRSIFKINLNFLFIFLFLNIFNLFLLMFFDCSQQFMRSIISLNLLIFVCLIFSNNSKLLELDISKISFILLNIILFFLLLDLFKSNFDLSLRKSSIFFSEPSHLALSVAPLIVILNRKYSSNLSLFYFIIFLVFSFSSTLFICLVIFFVLNFFYIHNINSKNVIFMSLALFIIFFALFNLPALEMVKDRYESLFEIGMHSNMSSMVYVNGWVQLNAYLSETNFFGLGFNNMGCNGPIDTKYFHYIYKMSDMYLNYNDGSFLISKFGSEFGLLGLLFLLSSVLFVYKSFNAYESRVLVPFIFITFFVRSAGYFEVSSMIFLFFLCKYLNASKNNHI